jgi:hypothetical protein
VVHAVLLCTPRLAAAAATAADGVCALHHCLVVKAIRQALLLGFLFVSHFHFFLLFLNTAPAVFLGVFLRDHT